MITQDKQITTTLTFMTLWWIEWGLTLTLTLFIEINRSKGKTYGLWFWPLRMTIHFHLYFQTHIKCAGVPMSACLYSNLSNLLFRKTNMKKGKSVICPHVSDVWTEKFSFEAAVEGRLSSPALLVSLKCDLELKLNCDVKNLLCNKVTWQQFQHIHTQKMQNHD